MLSNNIFIKRLWQEYRLQWEVIRTVLDWTIIAYIVIPAIIIVPFIYGDIWQQIELYWRNDIPFSLLLFVMLLLSLSGNIRTFIQEADLLFLIQQKTSFTQLKRWALLVSVLEVFFRITVIVVIFLPTLALVYNFSGTAVMLLYFTLVSFSFASMTIKKITYRTLSKWLALLLLFGLTLFLILCINPLLYGTGSLVIFLLIVFYHFTNVAKSNRWYLNEIEIEKTERIKYIKFILNFSMEVEKETYSNNKRPILIFPKSNELFKVRNRANGLLEILLKSMLRNNSYLSMYFQLVILTIAAIIIVPLWIKWLAYLSFVYFFHYWLRALYRKMLANHFFDVIPYNKELTDQVWIGFRNIFYVPTIIFTGIMTIFISIF